MAPMNHAATNLYEQTFGEQMYIFFSAVQRSWSISGTWDRHMFNYQIQLPVA